MRKWTYFLIPFTILLQNTWADDFSLNSFLQMVEKTNLDLKTQESMTNASQAKAVGVRIPAPSVAFIQRNFKNESADGFEVSQSIPFPGKITSEKRAREESAKAATEYFNIKINETLSQARLTYIEYWLQYELLNILKEKKKIIQDHVELARSVVRSNSMMKIHLLKAQSDLDLLENEIYKQDQVLVEKRLKIAEFLNKEASYNPPKPSKPPLSEIKEITVTDTPQIKNLELKLLAAKATESEKKKSWLPDLKLSYMELGSTSMMPEHSQISVGITLPFAFPWEPSSKSSEATAQRMVSEYQLEKGKRIIEYTQTRYREEAKTIKKQLSLIEQRLLPRAKETMKLVHNIAPRDMNSLQDHRDAMEAFTDLRLQALNLRNRYEQVASELLKFSENKDAIYE